jgi:hypothetical protein
MVWSYKPFERRKVCVSQYLLSFFSLLTYRSHFPPRSRPSFNPKAPIFLPRTQSQPPGPSRHAPPSPLSAPRTSPPYPEYRQQPSSRPMSPSSSGGVRIGRRMIGFGDFPEVIDLDLARQRVERQRSELSERRHREASTRADESFRHKQERPIFVRIDPNVDGSVNIPSQARAVSDCNILERDKPIEGRKRGLSSPERAAGLGFVRAGEV